MCYRQSSGRPAVRFRARYARPHHVTHRGFDLRRCRASTLPESSLVLLKSGNTAPRQLQRPPSRLANSWGRHASSGTFGIRHHVLREEAACTLLLAIGLIGRDQPGSVYDVPIFDPVWTSVLEWGRMEYKLGPSRNGLGSISTHRTTPWRHQGIEDHLAA